MPSQFTPQDRERLLAKLQDMDAITEAVPLGDGVVAHRREGRQTEQTFTGFVEERGWYVASYDTRPDKDRIVFMPITEVPG